MKKRKNQKPLGVLMVLGGLLLLGYLSYVTGPERSPLVWESFQKTQGVFMGYDFKGGRRVFLMDTREGVKSLIIDRAVTLNHIEVGCPIEVAVNVQDPNLPKIVRGEDVKKIPGSSYPNSDKCLLKRATPDPWFVQNGWAMNGPYQYRTYLQDGTYPNLYAVQVGGQWLAVD